MGTHPDDHILHTYLSYNLSFPSLSPVTTLITPTNDIPVLMDYTFGISKLHQTSDVPKLSPSWSTSIFTTLYSGVAVDIDNYCILIA